MEMKTNSMEVLIRQMPKSQKTDEKSVNDSSGFKKMMREKDLKKDTGSKDKKDLNKELETAVSNAGVQQTLQAGKNSEATDTQEQQGKEMLIAGMESLKSQLPDSLNSKEESGDTKSVDSFQLLKEFRLNNWNPEDDSALIQEKEDFNALNSLMPKKTVPDSQIGLTAQDEDIASLKNGKKEVNGPGEALLKMSGQVSSKSEKIVAEYGPGVTEKKLVRADGPGYRLKTDEKDSENDNDTAQDKISGMFQEKLIPSGQMSELSTHKAETVNTTLPVQNLEELNAKLSEKIISQIETGKKSLEVQLEPHNLGKILIKVAYEKDQVSVSVVCTESKTLKMLSQSAGELGTILENNLERPIHVIVDKQSPDYLNNNQEHQGNGREQQEQRQNHSEDFGDDFLQKLRLGISGVDSDEISK
ncbi:flagellar hook-length control protein FliK [Lacrimispora defluvii]|uniref:Flagellar hook-length control protein FliK n=1 Tax=Lacrimispora defluvii TaxID=2719233 RepID=A0ABX1VSU7_9FIRM|nr:flagellar hook-length control protein FliK [Lacrimispora defluvii]NNJ31179.1 flagellar hook-length control protein FliK [Lacrimispora defluvii]